MDNLADIGDWLKEIEDEIFDGVEASLQELGPTLSAEVRSTFDLVGRRGNHAEWVPVKFSTILGRQTFPGGPITLRDYWDTQGGELDPAQESYYRTSRPLYDTGALQNSIDHVVSRQSQSITLSVGSDLSYAESMDQGIGPVPARPFMYFTDSDIDLVDELLRKHL